LYNLEVSQQILSVLRKVRIRDFLHLSPYSVFIQPQRYHSWGFTHYFWVLVPVPSFWVLL